MNTTVHSYPGTAEAKWQPDAPIDLISFHLSVGTMAAAGRLEFAGFIKPFLSFTL